MEAGDQEKIGFKVWIGVWGTMLGAFMAVLDIQITNASLREITGGIAATQDEGSWISTSYLISEIVTIPLTAWLSRVIQRPLVSRCQFWPSRFSICREKGAATCANC